MQVTGLSPATAYYFLVRTFTNQDSPNPPIYGDYSLEVSATTQFKPGDVDGNKTVNLVDMILCLQVVSGIVPAAPIFVEAEATGDLRIGLEDAFWILQKLSGLRLGPLEPFPESDHPYANYFDHTWEYTLPGGPSSISVTFDPLTEVQSDCLGFWGDFIYVMDAGGNAISGSPFTGTSLAGQTVIVPGATVKIRLTTDDSGPTHWGFKVTNIQAAE